jgi:hypothetical protein
MGTWKPLFVTLRAAGAWWVLLALLQQANGLMLVQALAVPNMRQL